MRKISKKTLKRIKKGFYDDLMEAIGFLVDKYNEDKFNAGYESCLQDLSVRSQLLADYLQNIAAKYGNRGNDEINWLTVEQTAKAIEDYFNKALKQ